MTDFFGKVPFEQNGDVVTTARPVLQPVVHVRCTERNTPQIHTDLNGFVVMVTVVGGTCKPIEFEVPFPNVREDPLSVLKQELARFFSISPLQCSLRLQLQSTKFIPLTTARDFVHPAATWNVELTVLPFAVKGTEAAVETLPVMHRRLGMVCVVSVRGTRVVGKRIVKGHAVPGYDRGPPPITDRVMGVLYNEEEPWFSLFDFGENDIA